MYSKSCDTCIEFSLTLNVFPSAKDASRGRLSACLWNEEQVNSVVCPLGCSHVQVQEVDGVQCGSSLREEGFDAVFLDLPLSKRKITGKRARTFS